MSSFKWRTIRTLRASEILKNLAGPSGLAHVGYQHGHHRVFTHRVSVNRSYQL